MHPGGNPGPGYVWISDHPGFEALCAAVGIHPVHTILKRLEGAGMLVVRSAEHDGRLRKYYRITDKGIARIEDFKKEWEEMLSIYRFITKEEHRHE